MTPYVACSAPTVITTSTAVKLRRPRNSLYASGTTTNKRSCLLSHRLTSGAIENTAAMSVITAYAASGQNIRGTSMRSRSRMTRTMPSAEATVSRICAAAIENCVDAANASIVTNAAFSRREEVVVMPWAATAVRRLRGPRPVATSSGTGNRRVRRSAGRTDGRSNRPRQPTRSDMPGRATARNAPAASVRRAPPLAWRWSRPHAAVRCPRR